MVQISGKYQHVKNENFFEYLVQLGIPEDKARIADSLKPTVEVVVDGKRISVNSDSGFENASSTFTLDEEVDEPLPNNIVLKSTARFSGDTLTVTSTASNGKAGTRVYQFTNAELILTMTTGDPNGPVGKRYYKRV